MKVGFQSITDIGILMVIPEFRIAMLVGSQVITVIIRMEKECGIVGLITTTITGVVPTTITIL